MPASLVQNDSILAIDVGATMTINGTLTIRKEARYFHSHKDADAAYGFGFTWVPGKKD